MEIFSVSVDVIKQILDVSKPQLVPTNASAVIFLCHRDKACNGDDKNSHDKCAGEICDMNP